MLNMAQDEAKDEAEAKKWDRNRVRGQLFKAKANIENQT